MVQLDNPTWSPACWTEGFCMVAWFRRLSIADLRLASAHNAPMHQCTNAPMHLKSSEIKWNMLRYKLLLLKIAIAFSVVWVNSTRFILLYGGDVFVFHMLASQIAISHKENTHMGRLYIFVLGGITFVLFNVRLCGIIFAFSHLLAYCLLCGDMSVNPLLLITHCQDENRQLISFWNEYSWRSVLGGVCCWLFYNKPWFVILFILFSFANRRFAQAKGGTPFAVIKRNIAAHWTNLQVVVHHLISAHNTSPQPNAQASWTNLSLKRQHHLICCIGDPQPEERIFLFICCIGDPQPEERIFLFICCVAAVHKQKEEHKLHVQQVVHLLDYCCIIRWYTWWCSIFPQLVVVHHKLWCFHCEFQCSWKLHWCEESAGESCRSHKVRCLHLTVNSQWKLA